MGFTYLRHIISVRRSRLHREEGFTLIEVMVSAVIVVLLAASVAKALIASTDFSGYERYRSQADEVAQQDQERLKSMSDAQLANLNQTRNVVVGPTTYALHSTATFLSSSGTSSCTSGNTAYFKVTSNVAWNATKGNPVQSVTEETIITRPVSGSLTLKVIDQNANGLSGVTVTPTGTNTGYTTNGVTDPTGCAAFAGLPNDGYTLALNDPGYVDIDGNPNPSETATVNSTGVTAATQMVMGQAGTITPNFATWDATNGASAVGVPAGFRLSYYGNGAGNHMTVFKTVGSFTSAATNLSASNLFPFSLPGPSYTSNYQIWAGSCEQEQPLQPPAGMDSASVNPGGGVTATVAEPAVDVAAKYNGSPVTPTDVNVNFASTSGGACSETWHKLTPLTTETVSSVSYGVYPAPFASSAAKGTATASASGDTGYLTVCVDYKVGTKYYSLTSGQFSNTNFAGPTFMPTLADLKTSGTQSTTGCG